MLGFCLSHPQVPRDHLDVLWGQSCVSLGMKKGGPGGQSREPAGHQGSDWEELGDALSGYPIPALCPWSFEVSLHHLLPLLSHLPPPTLSHPSRCHRAVDLNSLHNTANFHWLSDFTYGNIYVPVLSVCLTLSFFPPPHPCPQRPGYKGPWNS